MSERERIDDLAARYLDGALSAAEAAEWERMLVSDPAATLRLAELARLEAGMRTHLSVGARSGEQVTFKGHVRTPAVSEKRYRWFAIGSAALLTLCVGAAWYAATRGGAGDSGARVISGKVSPERRRGGIGFDEEVTAGEESELALADGSRIRMTKGARVALRRPGEGERARVSVLEGKSEFSVAKAAGGFRVASEVGEVNVSEKNFSVEVRDQEKGAGEMKLSKVMVVAVLAGVAEVNVGGVAYSVAGGQSRAFGGEEGGADRPRREGEREGRPRRMAGVIASVGADAVTVTVRGDAGERTETLKVGPKTAVDIQMKEDRVVVGEGGRETRRPRVFEGGVADLKVGERIEAQVGADGVAVRIVQVRAGAKEGEARREGDRPRPDGERRDGEARREGDRPRPDAPRREGAPDRPRPDGERKEGEARREGDRPRPDGERREGDRPRPDGERRDGEVRKDRPGEAEEIRNARKRAGLEDEKKREGER